MVTRSVAFEDSRWRGFLPLAHTRPLADLRVGAATTRQQLELLTGQQVGVWCRPEVAAATELDPGESADLYLARGWWRRLPAERPRPWLGIADGQIALVAADAALASRLSPETLLDSALAGELLEGVPRHDIDECVSLVEWWWQLLDVNAAALAALEPGLHVDPSADIRDGAVLDTTDGAIHVGAGVIVHGSASLQGPCAIGPGCVILPQASVRAGSSIGPTCKVGGEVEESVLHGFSNKQHHGYLGHSVVGSWANLGAGTTTSDLKSTYGTISTAAPGNPGELVDTGRQFLGAVIGDHAKTAIDTGISAGTTVGVCSALFTRTCPRTVGSFAWVTEEGVSPYEVDRAIEVARRVMARRDRILDAREERCLRAIAAM